MHDSIHHSRVMTLRVRATVLLHSHAHAAAHHLCVVVHHSHCLEHCFVYFKVTFPHFFYCYCAARSRGVVAQLSWQRESTAHSARLDSARLDSARLDSARLDGARLVAPSLEYLARSVVWDMSSHT